MGALRRHRGNEFSLTELVSTAEKILSSEGDELVDGRVSAVPDIRTIRYYQTSGLLSKPLRYDGRKAVYGYLHLLQIVFIKQLQAEGYPLSVIQRALFGRSEDELEEKLSEVLPSAHAPRAAVAKRGAPIKALLGADIAPGISITIDPARVRDAEKILSEMLSALAEFMEK